MTKKRLLKKVIEQIKDKKPGIENLEQYMTGMPALMFTKENPFSLFQELQQNKSSAPAKGGQTAPKDIVVTAGPTPFAPGPVIGELGALGIKAGVEDGKVTIKEDKVVATSGDVISAELAGLLTRLSIEPMEVGLNVTAVYENGTIFPRSVLDIDIAQYKTDIENTAREAFNLAFFTGFPTEETIKLMVQTAFMDTKALALSQGILADGVVEEIIAKAEIQALSLKAKVEA